MIACTAKGEAEIVKRLDGWETSVTRGYVHVACSYCRQKFQDMELLHGKASLEDRVLEYGYVEEDTFPVPRNEKAIPPNAKVILWLGKDGGIVKALPNTKENREAGCGWLYLRRKKKRKRLCNQAPHMPNRSHPHDLNGPNGLLSLPPFIAMWHASKPQSIPLLAFFDAVFGLRLVNVDRLRPGRSHCR